MPNSPRSSEINRRFSAEVLASDLDDLFKGVKDRLAAPIPVNRRARSHRCDLPADKWLLSSAVQKLIRRGLAEQAVKTALALHTLDPAYLPRRLPIIAFEDIGVGNLEVCFDTLHLFGTQRFAANTPELEQRRLLANLVFRLAKSVKSRAACDILCLAHADEGASRAAAKFARSSEPCLIAMASDRRAATTSRALALHLLTGMSVQEGRWHRTVSRFNAGALNAVAERLDLPKVIAWILLAGRNTSGLAAMLPLVVEAATNGADFQIRQTKGSEQVYAEKPFLGVPACSADMYTRVGKGVIAEFSKAIRQKHPRFFESFPDARSLSQLVGMAIFHVEGSKLDRWLENKTLAEYRERIEQAELYTLGLPDPESRHKLYRILEGECELLWQIRQSNLRATFGKGRRGK